MAENKNQIVGRFYLFMNGKRLPLEGDGSIKSLGTPSRETVVGDQAHGYKEVPKAPEAEFTVVQKSDVSPTEIAKLSDFTCKVEADTGKSYVLANAWVGEVSDISGGGSFKVTIGGVGQFKET